jgi:hypothetical protein
LGYPKIEKPFERFIQADISDKMARQGTGLGLSILKRMLKCLEEKYGLKVKRERFNILFYYSASDRRRKNGSDKGILSGKLISEDISRLKILAVDDNKISRLLISILKENSKALLEASTGIESILAAIMLTLI